MTSSVGGFPIPKGLPIPQDDGGCDHLQDFELPSLTLSSTSGKPLKLDSLAGLNILFTYPRTAAPGEDVPEEWNAIPGARGCSPQACSFRDEMKALKALGIREVYGLSTQDTAYQTEAKERLHLSYDLLSDERLDFVHALKFPTLDWKGNKLVKRTVLMVEDGTIVKVLYPVFPSDASAALAKGWLEARKEAGSSK